MLNRHHFVRFWAIYITDDFNTRSEPAKKQGDFDCFSPEKASFHLLGTKFVDVDLLNVLVGRDRTVDRRHIAQIICLR